MGQASSLLISIRSHADVAIRDWHDDWLDANNRRRELAEAIQENNCLILLKGTASGVQRTCSNPMELGIGEP